MKKAIFFFFLIFVSCEGFPLLQRDQENVFFYENITTTKKDYLGKLSIATYNIKFGFCQNCNPFSGELGGDHTHLDRIADFINTLDLDIISLQEVGYNYDATIIKNQIKYIANKTNMNFSYGMGRALQTGDNLFLNGFWGNAILSKYKIINIENPAIRFIDYYNQNRCLKATIRLSENKEIIVLSTHFESGSTEEEKILQISNLNNIIQDEDKPLIFAADLNIPYYEGNYYLEMFNGNLYNSLENLGTSEKQAIVDTGTFVNGSVIDYIFTDKINFTILSGVLPPQAYRDISDHYPYIVYLVE